MPALDSQNILIQSDASNLAFHAGQLFERLLLENAVETAKQNDSVMVEQSHVLSSLKMTMIEQISKELNVRLNDNSRKAA